ncbi:STY4851/ECs_5259 family protein [Thiohalorhabdus denitrificans]|uniref:STY4851/ECs_5259 family protein n=1 Tax=Thiohalorhabdus denitrificans TaxID=381306 RepID=UPI001C408ED4|nr:STY4851/ECs_5259 family protein [Thiohalorhabdus denitrificans]
MDCTTFLKEFLFTHARLTGKEARTDARGWPLYAYRCSEKAYQDVMAILKEVLPQGFRGSPPLGLEACFCLFAAETFRREHSGGSWTWATVFDPLDMEPPSHPVIGGWVERGLKKWGREVLRGAEGQRLFLATIACEGGLPLRLLQKEGANLRTFFRRLLEAYHQSSATQNDIERLAREHIRYLPKTLRNEEVVRLAASLIGGTVDLQDQVGDARDPIATLDEQDPYWRLQLPLRLEDEVAASLFQNLVEDSRTIARAASARPFWHGTLVETSPGQFSPRKVLHFPERLSRPDIEHWLGSSEYAPPRIRLQLETPRGPEPVAVLTLFPREGSEDIYRREWLRRDGVVLKGAGVEETHDILFHDGTQAVEIDLQNGIPWGESPWVFSESTRERGWVWVAEGSVDARSEEVLVAIPASCRPDPASDASCEHRGELTESARPVYRVRGRVDFFMEDGARYRIQCGAPQDTTEPPRLGGPQLTGLLNQRPVFLGMPGFYENAGFGQRRAANEEPQWRPVGGDTGWSSNFSGCLGQVWIRLVDSVTGVERLRRQADVVPPETTLSHQLGSKGKPGYYVMKGLAPMEPKVVEPGTVHLETWESTKDELTLRCDPVQSHALAPVRVRLSVPGTYPVELKLPYPQKGAMFQLEGHRAEAGELVALDRLYALYLILQHPSGTERFFLEAELVRGGHTLGEQGFSATLPPMEGGRMETNLGPWVDQVNHLLATTDHPNAFVRLMICSQWGQELTRVHVAQYDMGIYPDREEETIELAYADIQRLGEDWSSRISVSMLPLWEPGREPRSLFPTDDTPGIWPIPEDLEPGPWWVIARDGDWARFRPLLWTVTNGHREDMDAETGGLSAAVRETDSDRRIYQIDEALQRLGAEPEHEDWELLLEYVALATEFSPKALDPLRRLVLHPTTLAMALLRADQERFDRLMLFPTQMSFAWGLLPVGAWHQAASRYFTQLGESLVGIDGAEDILWQTFTGFRERATKVRPYFDSLCDWLGESLFPGRGPANNSLKLTRQMPADFIDHHVATEIEALQGRHDADERWPTGAEVMEAADGGLLSERFRFADVTGIQRPVKCAPFVAASFALNHHGDQTPGLVYELRLIRGFDHEWFDRAYSIGLTFGLAKGREEMRKTS